MDIVLVAGLWLRHSIWSDVATELGRMGHRPLPVPLPGVDDASASATLEDQVAAVLGVIDDASRPMVVGHSAASGLAWLAADRRPEAIARVVLVGGFPVADGGTYADFFPSRAGAMPFPGWAAFEGPDSADLTDSQRERLELGAVPVPDSVARAVVRLSDPRRFDVPVLLVCPEYSADQARAWLAAGEVAELPRASRIDYADIDTGHWPMVTRPADLARVLDAAARGE